MDSTLTLSEEKVAKRNWTPDEDTALVAAVNKYGACRWSLIATELLNANSAFVRVGKQCRERWNNHLCPEVKKSEWSDEEDMAIVQGVSELGTRWCEIIKAPALAGRTDNAIKNRYYALQRRVGRQNACSEGLAQKQRGSKESVNAMTADQREKVAALALQLAAAQQGGASVDDLLSKLVHALHNPSGSDDALNEPEMPGSPFSLNESSSESSASDGSSRMSQTADDDDLRVPPFLSWRSLSASSISGSDSPRSPGLASHGLSPDVGAPHSPAICSSRAADAAPVNLSALPARRSFAHGWPMRAMPPPLLLPDFGSEGDSPLKLTPKLLSTPREALVAAEAAAGATDSPKRQRTPLGWCASPQANTEASPSFATAGPKAADGAPASPTPWWSSSPRGETPRRSPHRRRAAAFPPRAPSGSGAGSSAGSCAAIGTEEPDAAAARLRRSSPSPRPFGLRHRQQARPRPSPLALPSPSSSAYVTASSDSSCSLSSSPVSDCSLSSAKAANSLAPLAITVEEAGVVPLPLESPMPLAMFSDLLMSPGA